MNSFVLKIIACISMFIDHIGYVIFSGASWFNYIGRLAFPIFAFQISEGYVHTHNKKQYFIRLLIFAIISQIPFLMFHSIINDSFAINVIFTLLLGFLSILIYDKINKFVGIFVAILLGLCAESLKFDYGFYGVAIIFLFYIFRDNKHLLAFSFIITTLCKYSYLVLKFLPYGLNVIQFAFSYYLPLAIGTCLSIIAILLYNKKKGPNTRYLLYLFYPLHLIFIYLINIFI